MSIKKITYKIKFIIIKHKKYFIKILYLKYKIQYFVFQILFL